MKLPFASQARGSPAKSIEDTDLPSQAGIFRCVTSGSWGLWNLGFPFNESYIPLRRVHVPVPLPSPFSCRHDVNTSI